MGKYATKEQLTALVADMASKINIASGTQGVSGSYVPIGFIEGFMGVEAPPDFLVCDGSLHSIASYPQLADHFYEQFGASNYFGGNGTTTFGVPNSTEWDTPTVPPNDTPVLWCIKAIDEKIQPGGGGIDYSTEEQDTGVKWIDGKPIYQKIITYNVINCVPNQYTTVTSVASLNIDSLISARFRKCDGDGNSANGFVNPFNYNVENNDLIVYMVGTNDRTNSCIMQYTKTTD